jgi:predicted small lipoprotein YifL
MQKAVLRLSIAVALAAAVAGCGIKSGLDSPASKSTASAESGQGKKQGAAAKPHEGFILDGLIR